jgi:DNA-binding MarR family transcriptional regulator/N-acetylglutamate synthase-like GNAT family acetyltransferase
MRGAAKTGEALGADPADPVARVRAFNRFYTSHLGVLQEGFLDSPYSLTESRVLFELAQRDATQLTELRRDLDIDAGYMSRILSRLEADGLVARRRTRSDGRRQVVRLSQRGRGVFEALDRRSAADVGAVLSQLSEQDQRRLLAAMATVRTLLGEPRTYSEVSLRQPASGDFGWVVERHGALYAQEYGWDERFEALVARLVADHIEHRDPAREQAWIAEVDGERAGCVVCAKKEPEVAQLRLLLVEPWARGCGVGTRLVEECIAFATRAQYDSVVLWTNDVLKDARRIYERAGFTLADERKHHNFGHDLVGQTWRKAL